MNYEFQALCRNTVDNNGVSPTGEPFTVRHICADDKQFEAILKQGGLFVMPGGITELWPAVDFNLPNFNTDEAAAWLRIKGGTLSQVKAIGEIPFSMVNGRPIYIRSYLEKLLLENSNPAGKQIASQFKKAA